MCMCMLQRVYNFTSLERLDIDLCVKMSQIEFTCGLVLFSNNIKTLIKSSLLCSSGTLTSHIKHVKLYY